MPYQSNQELPQDVRESLPEDAQDVYRQAYNVACDPTRSEREQDEAATKEAWMAVESEFEWSENHWQSRGRLRANPEAGIMGAQYTESKSVRQFRDDKSWTPGKSHTNPSKSSEGKN